ncbi:hypothetical protein C440_04848 [Haloferax mucosum ATCC BAA-1512]|uniref:Uncharacterized protein n=1 Tax=Haloferax mucosum ATCC BAA-1512 TaxID=662479 RepID=M0IK85_9EURY|nr:hypothetical protein [Haloferax mucosum]ELZ96447.1 hypothetical protein C440_04848 [Haloferax mucosum ATCC BAA-1512]
MDEPTHQCGNCDSWFAEYYDYCPECGYAAVEKSRPGCSLCLNEMEFIGTRGEINPSRLYYCHTCEREWVVTHIDVID